MACPHVASAGTMLMIGGYSNTEAIDQLTATTEEIRLPENKEGAGLLDHPTALGIEQRHYLSYIIY